MGYRMHTRGLPKYEQREPDISFYAKLEIRSTQPTVIEELQDKNGDVYSDNPNLMRIATDFYTDLYTPSPWTSLYGRNFFIPHPHGRVCMGETSLYPIPMDESVWEKLLYTPSPWTSLYGRNFFIPHPHGRVCMGETSLYPIPMDESVWEKLLGNVDHTLTDQQKCILDEKLSEK